MNSKSNYISLGIIVQNGKTNYFYTIWAKNTHTSLCIIVHLCTIATVTVHICTVIVACVFTILLISIHTFFSLSSPCTSNELSFPFLIFFFLRCTQTNTPTPTHKHIDIDKSTEIHKHTHTQTNPHGQTNREIDWSSWVLIGAWSELVGLNRCLIGARGSWPVLN